MRSLLLTLLGLLWSVHALASLPTICSIVNSSNFRSCLSLQTSLSMCGFPPRPCVHFSYYLPQYFTEVVSNPGESFFTSLPGAALQLGAIEDIVPFGAEDDAGAYSFHAHTANVPFSMWATGGLPCGGALIDNLCLSSMSEHLGALWKTGQGDLLQPAWLAWSASPKACLIKGAMTSVNGDVRPTGYPYLPLCSVDRSWMKRFPPSASPVCNGWGILMPRYGTVTSSDQTTASLVIASRMRSLGSEVFQAVPTFFEEKMQMIYPQSSSCFREGQNVGILRAKRVSELGRIFNGKMKNYLYATWRQVSCTRDVPYIASTHAWLSALQAACRGMK